MKTLITNLFLIASVLSFSQNAGISVQFTQDVRLATMEDDHGNKPFTPDVRMDLVLQSNDFGKYETSIDIGVNIEYADLRGGSFLRWGVHGGVSTKYDFFGLTDYKLYAYGGGGQIHRMGDNRGFMSFELGIDLSVEIAECLEFVTKLNLMQRGDLKQFGDKAANYTPWDWQPQWAIGVKYKFIKL